METTFGAPQRSSFALLRSLNSAFLISPSYDANVSYSVDIACTISLAGGQQGTLFLEQADDSGFAVNVEEICRSVNGNTGTVVIGVNMTQNVTATVSGTVLRGKWCRLRTQNNTGTPVFTYRSGQETLLM